MSALQQVCDELQRLQRQRVNLIKTRVMITNRLVMTVAVAEGYNVGLEADERTEAIKKSKALIKQILLGELEDSPIRGLVLVTNESLSGFERQEKIIERLMVETAKRLHIVDWVEAEEQRGFGILSLAILVGECGNLLNYPNPAKLWRRMGCAPFQSKGVHRMGAAWKSNGLSAEEWEEFGYIPRRRSVSYLWGDNIVKQNNAGPYRLRYDEVKEAKLALNAKEWPKLRCHRHAMLLATKLLLKNLWIEWHRQ